MAIEGAYKYIVVGGGLTGANAVAGIRELDKEGSILFVGAEIFIPYDRPPLTKKLWFGQKKVQDIFVQDEQFYIDNHIDVKFGTRIYGLDSFAKVASDNQGNSYQYEKLLLATGGIPRTMTVPGSDVAGICYYRYLPDYLRIREKATPGATAVVVGGGFIGSEISAALNINQVEVTLVQREDYLVSRVFPEELGRAIQERYEAKGVKILSRDSAATFEKQGEKFITTTQAGQRLESDILIVGVGIIPMTTLADQADLQMGNGIVVNEYLQSSNPDIYAAGDNANFPYQALGKQTRVEHWDNAIEQGKQAGRNMTGANEPYTHMPYFFSDLFEFGYEAVGEVDSRLETFADWEKENDTGVIYYLQDGKVRGAMMCNVWEKVEAARQLIREGRTMSHDDLQGAITQKAEVG